MKKPFTDMTDEELQDGLRQQAEHLVPSYSGYYDELVRRSQDRHATAIKWLTVATVFVGLVAAIAAILAAVK
jgi:hypothetical protein